MLTEDTRISVRQQFPRETSSFFFYVFYMVYVPIKKESNLITQSISIRAASSLSNYININLNSICSGSNLSPQQITQTNYHKQCIYPLTYRLILMLFSFIIQLFILASVCVWVCVWMGSVYMFVRERERERATL